MFKETFKYFKSKCPPPDFSSVIDFDKVDLEKVIEVPIRDENLAIAKDYRIRGLIPVSQWKVFELKNRPGLLFIRNPFTKRGQRYWIARCLRDYPKAPHSVNMSPKHFTKETIDDWWTSLQMAKNSRVTASEVQRLKNGMRWSTLGYHHDWDTKVYSEAKRNIFPHDLATLSSFLSHLLGFGEYSAEAAIVNFYPLGTTLAGHTDHSEKNLNAPLFSFSFGQTAVFLIGGKTRDEKPAAIFLKSGDIAIMSRESRLSYHAVPKILKTDVSWINEPLEQEINSTLSTTTSNRTSDDADDDQNAPKRRRLNVVDDDIDKSVVEYNDRFVDDNWTLTANESTWRPFGEYISDSRININVRQVLELGESSL